MAEKKKQEEEQEQELLLLLLLHRGAAVWRDTAELCARLCGSSGLPAVQRGASVRCCCAEVHFLGPPAEECRLRVVEVAHRRSTWTHLALLSRFTFSSLPFAPANAPGATKK